MSQRSTQAQTGATTQERTERPRLWNVVLHNDDDHTFEYVVEMLQSVFGFGLERAVQVMRTAHNTGRAVCVTTHLEHAELKRDQIGSFGPDRLLARSKGSCRATIEPAVGGEA